MNLDIHFVVFVLGILVTAFGGFVLFNEDFFRKMGETWWKPTEADKKSWSPEGMRNFNKYGRGIGAFLGGIILLIFSFLYYLGH
jgi:hypothetical protein